MVSESHIFRQSVVKFIIICTVRLQASRRMGRFVVQPKNHDFLADHDKTLCMKYCSREKTGLTVIDVFLIVWVMRLALQCIPAFHDNICSLHVNYVHANRRISMSRC